MNKNEWIETSEALIAFSKISQNYSSLESLSDFNYQINILKNYIKPNSTQKDLSELWMLELQTIKNIKIKNYSESSELWKNYLTLKYDNKLSPETFKRDANLTFNILNQTYKHTSEKTKEFF